ncbi:hypothetical protein BI081_gp235 [Mycobacterium phage Tonenili]|uniref:Uncharacterized protein n=1 Tax=Mycobacterium phage Tonenili TaxID=1891703 RepID=A0A1C9EHA2_9CAUD|nr:hypothetical protein BI081_gp235 [Mycobacterium phage Tonenili]AON96872.1 hypothetical protein SEA_TONENILI_125 [Mycobacterium phage Tonenili]
MPEYDHVRGIEGRTDLPGPPYDPPTHTWAVPVNDVVRTPKGDPGAKRKQYIEIRGPQLEFIETRDDAPESDEN